MQTFSQASPAIAESLFANIAAQLPQMYAYMPGVEMSPDGNWIGMCSNDLGLIFNSVYGTRFSRDRLDRQVESVLSFYASRNALPMAWGITPTREPIKCLGGKRVQAIAKCDRYVYRFGSM
jgi:hypothetical protein